MTKRNEQMAIISVEDYTHEVTVVVFPKTYGKCMNAIAIDMAVCIRGRADINDESIQILAEDIQPLDNAGQGQTVVSPSAARHMGALWHPGMGTKMFIKIPAHLEQTDLSTTIAKVLAQHHGPVRVYFHLMGSRRTILTNEQYWVQTDDELRQQLESLLEPGSIIVK
jgi:DNA polymerase-3 subunit alpha